MCQHRKHVTSGKGLLIGCQFSILLGTYTHVTKHLSLIGLHLCCASSSSCIHYPVRAALCVRCSLSQTSSSLLRAALICLRLMHLLAGPAVRAALIRLCLLHLLAGLPAVRAALIRLRLLHLLAGPAVRAALIRLCLLHLLAGPAVRAALLYHFLQYCYPEAVCHALTNC